MTSSRKLPSPLLVALAIAIAGGAGLAGCSEGVDVVNSRATGPAPAGFDRNAMLRSFAQTIVLPTYEDLAMRTATLRTEVAEYADAVRQSAPDKAQRLADAQQAWVDVMTVAQEAELLQFGPAGTPGVATAGQGLRDPIYSYPTTDPCKVDQELVANQFGNPGFIQGSLVTASGLDALEVLLFDTDTTNNCPQSDPINAGGTWDALVQSGQIEQRRADYAAVVATGVRDTAAQLRDRWSPTGGNFVAELGEAGLTSTIYFSVQDAIDEVFAGLFYLDIVTKDLKVAQPAGLSGPGAADPGLVESRFAGRSKEHIIANLVAFQRFLVGNRPTEPARLGFDEFLSSAGAPDLSVTMQVDTTEAIAAFQAINGTLESAVVNDLPSVLAAFDELKDITDNLKSQFVSVLNLTLPQQGAGDDD